MKRKNEIVDYVKPYYEEKDTMHNMSHINRVINKAKELSGNYKIDFDVIELGAYFHGIINTQENEIIEFLNKLELNNDKINSIIEIAKASHKDRIPHSIEGKILHDAHILEGGKYFQIVKSLVTGSARQQSLEETINYFSENIIGKFNCYLPESKKELEEKEKYSREILVDIQQSL